MARPLRRGGGKGLAIKKKNIFVTFFKSLLPLKNKNYFNLDNLSKYGHMLKFVGRYFIWVVFVQKLGAEIKLSKSVSGYFMTKIKNKKILWPLSQMWGGGKALIARPLREKPFFCGFPKATFEK